MTLADDYFEALETAYRGVVALTEEHVDVQGPMGPDTLLTELDALRDAAQRLWDEALTGTWEDLGTLPTDLVARTAFSLGVLVGWRSHGTGD
jgi:hypothetical protein